METEIITNNFIPAGLTEAELQHWKVVAPKLIELGIIDSLNYSLLVRYCKLYCKTAEIIEHRPSHTAISSLNRQLKLLEQDLCLTPNSYNKWLKDRLIIEERTRKAEKHKAPKSDNYKESFFE